MSLIALPPVDQDIETPAGDEISAGSFWPAQSTAAIRGQGQISGAVSETRLREAILNAIGDAGRALAQWRAAQISAGFSNLAAVPADEIGGESEKVILFRRAVTSFVRADVAELAYDFDATVTGEKRAERLEKVIDDHRRNARWALRDLIGKARTTVALI